jgi:hypothetical protein
MTEKTKTVEKANIKEHLENTKEFIENKFDEINEKYLKKHYQKHLESAEKTYNRLNKKRLSIEKQARKKLDKTVKRGKKMVTDQPIYKTIEKNFNKGFDAIPSLVNLPAKKDIENLTVALEALNANVSALQRQS